MRIWLVTVLFVLASSLSAHDGATGIVKERMDNMSRIAEIMKALAGLIKGNDQYDETVVVTLANELETLAGENLTNLFPEGEMQMVSAAREEIWENWLGFESHANDLAIYAQGLAIAADNYGEDLVNPAQDEITLDILSQMPPREVFQQISGTCSGCHQDFRTRK